MLPPAVIEQQAKLGVSAEESKAQRIQRQQARFRSRGGAFVPSDTNPLVNILLARTVSGESPSKAPRKDVKRPSKAHTTSPVRGVDTVISDAGGSKSSLPEPKKRKAKVAQSKADVTGTPAPKRRGRPAKGKKKTQDTDPNEEQPPPNTKPKSISKGRGKRRDAGTAALTRNGKLKSKATVVEALVSDDEQTLVEVPRKMKPGSKRKPQCGDEIETDDDIPAIKKRVLPSTDDQQMSDARNALGIKTEKTVGPSRKNKGGETTMQKDQFASSNVKKGRGARDDQGDGKTPVVKKNEVTTSAKSKTNVRLGESCRVADDEIRSGKAAIQNVAEPVHEERPPARTPKSRKRKKEEDNCDDRPRKAVKFSDSGLPHSSSRQLKENQSNKERNNLVRTTDEPVLRPKQANKPLSRPKSKGPPQEVLERIKASAVRHLQCADSEPDELDCLP